MSSITAVFANAVTPSTPPALLPAMNQGTTAQPSGLAPVEETQAGHQGEQRSEQRPDQLSRRQQHLQQHAFTQRLTVTERSTVETAQRTDTNEKRDQAPTPAEQQRQHAAQAHREQAQQVRSQRQQDAQQAQEQAQKQQDQIQQRQQRDQTQQAAQEQQHIEQLKQRDRSVRQHEQAHQSAVGALASASRYQYQQGPDQVRYAVAGEVSIDVRTEENPQATIDKMEQIRRAALAPAQPSNQDRLVANAAQQRKQAAQQAQQQEHEQPEPAQAAQSTPQQSPSAADTRAQQRDPARLTATESPPSPSQNKTDETDDDTEVAFIDLGLSEEAKARLQELLQKTADTSAQLIKNDLYGKDQRKTLGLIVDVAV